MSLSRALSLSPASLPVCLSLPLTLTWYVSLGPGSSRGTPQTGHNAEPTPQTHDGLYGTRLADSPPDRAAHLPPSGDAWEVCVKT